GMVSRPDLLRAIRTELEICWAELMENLPAATEAELNRDTAAGRQFHAAVVKLWTATRTFEVTKTIAGTNGEAVAARASLISRVRTGARDYLNGNRMPRSREKWCEVQHAFSAWWRPYVVPGEGISAILLAMRWEITEQIGISLPGVTDQTSLTDLGVRLGVI